MVLRSGADYAPWASATSPLPRLAVAELICREADRIDPSRMRRPCHCIWRAAFAPSPKILRELLQQRANTPFIGQRFAGLAPGSADRAHRVACPGRGTSSPVRPNLAFQYTQVSRPETYRAHPLGRAAVIGRLQPSRCPAPRVSFWRL
jgi:hypothetical protein